MIAHKPAVATAVLSAAVLSTAAAACTPAGPPSASRSSCSVVFSAPPSASVVMIDPDSRLARAGLKTLLFTARPNEHIIILNADTGTELGSYTTPPGMAIRGPAPPTPLPHDPTQVQLYAHRNAVAKYNRELRQDLTQLQERWLPDLSEWAGQTFAETAAEHDTNTYPAAESHGFTVALTATLASITSLESIPGLHLGNRIVLAILGLDGVPSHLASGLAISLRNITVAVTGFDVPSTAASAWRHDFLEAGASEAVIMTSATSNELAVVVEPVLDGLPQSPAHGCNSGTSPNHQ